MNCIVVNSNQSELSILEKWITQIDDLLLEKVFTKGVEALNFLQKNEVGLLFVAAELSDINGFELIDSLRKPPLIVVTAKEQKTIHLEQVVERHLLDYLVHPIAFPRFLSTFNHAKKILALHQVPNHNAPLFVRADGKWHRLDFSNILYIQAQGDYVRIFTAHDTYMVNKPLKTVLDLLPLDTFARVHRSYIVHINQIDTIEDNSIVIGRDVIPISESYKNGFMNRLNLL